MPNVGDPMNLTTKTTMALVQKTGAARPDGRYDAEISYDDVRIEGTMNGRSARLDSTTNGQMVTAIPSPDGKPGMTMDLRMTGSGTMRMDLDRGFPRSSEV